MKDSESIHWNWTIGSALFWFFGVVVLVFWGPFPSYFLSGLGLFISLFLIILSIRHPASFLPKSIHLILFLLHALLLAAAVMSAALFLTGIPASQMKLPLIGDNFQDSNGIFSLKGPMGWHYFPTQGRDEYGVRIIPGILNPGEGRVEVQVWIRLMKEKPAVPEDFIRSMAESLSISREKDFKKTVFSRKIEETPLLDGSTGILSVMELKKRWIPIRQLTLYGIKGDRYLVSVSVSGLKKDSALSRILALGIFETIEPVVVSNNLLEKPYK